LGGVHRPVGVRRLPLRRRSRGHLAHRPVLVGSAGAAHGVHRRAHRWSRISSAFRGRSVVLIGRLTLPRLTSCPVNFVLNCVAVGDGRQRDIGLNDPGDRRTEFRIIFPPGPRQFRQPPLRIFHSVPFDLTMVVHFGHRVCIPSPRALRVRMREGPDAKLTARLSRRDRSSRLYAHTRCAAALLRFASAKACTSALHSGAV